MKIVDEVLNKFRELYKETPLLVCSPGRVNFIGEHTDYNLGFVLPAAINKAVYFAITPRSDEKCHLHALDLNDYFEHQVSSIKYPESVIKHQEKNWVNYLLGVIDQLKRAGYKINGFNCVFGGDIPIGAGLSSSAALEAGLAFALNHIFMLEIEKLDLVKIAQKSENEFVGVQCGIMDQFANIFGKDENVLRIDCRSLEYEYFPFDFPNISVVLFDTKVSHSLASSEYNIRRSECSSGVKRIRKDFSNINSLRDISIELLQQYENKFDKIIYKRCKYVIEENSRLQEACKSLTCHDLKSFGYFMYRTHEGLRSEYEVSCPELDYLVEESKNFPQVYGARMMGGGFGGCTINLIENDSVAEVSKMIMDKYKCKFGKEGKVYITKINNGTGVI